MFISIVGKAHQVIEQAQVNARAAIGKASMPDVESMAALKIVVLNLRIDVDATLCARWLSPVKVIQDGRRGLPPAIRNLHGGTTTPLRHLALAAKRCRRNCNLRPLYHSHANADR